MLTSLMPSVRDLRTPLAAGYIWLFAGWLAIHGHVSHHGPIGQVIVPLRSLFAYLGKPAALAALSFVGFAIGSSLEVRSDRFWAAAGWVGRRLRVHLPWTTGAAVQSLYSYSRASSSAQPIISGIAEAPMPQYEAVALAVSRNLPELADGLQASSKDLFDQYDRLKAEADFRINTALAVTALAAALTWNYGPVFLLLLAFSMWFAAKSFSRLRRANEVLCRALVLGKTSSLDVTALLDGRKSIDELRKSASTEAPQPRKRWPPRWMRRPKPSAVAATGSAEPS